MDTRKLKVLKTVIDSGTVSAAAKILRVSQPAVSKTISQIEAELGLALFDRKGGHLRPTAQAIFLRPRLEQALAGIALIERTARELKHGLRGKISVAAPTLMCAGVIPSAIVSFRQKFPLVDFSIVNSTSSEVVRLVASHEVDLGFSQVTPYLAGVDAVDAWTGQIVCLMPIEHPLSHREFITAADLKEENIITINQNEPTGARVASAFENEGITPIIAAEVSQSLTLCSLVQEGAGVALIDSFVPLIGAFSGLVARPFHPTIEIRMRGIISTTKPLSSAASTFLEAVVTASQTRHSWLTPCGETG